MESDELQRDGEQPKAKRPRVGHPSESLLKPVEDETVLSGRPRHLRALMLHAGQPRGSEPMCEAVRNQADDIGFAFGTDASLVIDIVFERCAATTRLTLLRCLNSVQEGTSCSIRSNGARIRLGMRRGRPSAATQRSCHIQLIVIACLLPSLALPCSALSLPASVPIISAVVALASKRVPALAVSVSSLLSDRLSAALTAGNCLQARLLLRFLAGLGACGAIEASAVVTQLQFLLDAASAAVASASDAADDEATAQRQRREATALVYLALLTLPYFANKAGTAGAAVGAGNPAVEQALTSLLASAGELVTSLCPSVEQAVQCATALTSARQAEFEGWLDVSQSKADSVPLASLASPPLARLWAAVSAAVKPSAAAADDEDGSAGENGSGASSGSTSSRFCGLAAATIARVQDDKEVADALFVKAREALPPARGRGAARAGGESSFSGPRTPAIPQLEDKDKAAAGDDDSAANASTSDAAASSGDAAGSASGDAAMADESSASASSSAEGSSAAAAAAVTTAVANELTLPVRFKFVVRTNLSSSSSSADDEEDLTGDGAAHASKNSGVRATVFGVAASASPDDVALAEPAPLPSTMAPAPHLTSRWFVKPANTIFGPGGLTSTPAVMRSLQLAGATSLDLLLVREVASDVIVTYHPFTDATAQALLALPMGPIVPVPSAFYPPSPEGDPRPVPTSPIAVEAILTQMMWPAPSAPFSTVYYGNLVLNLLKARVPEGGGSSSGSAQPPTVQSVVSIACRALWKYVGLLDEGAVRTLTAWQAFHASHLKWGWMWGDMTSVLAEPSPAGGGVAVTDPQRRFALGLIERSFALLGPWSYDRVVPDAFKPLISAGLGHLLLPKVTEAARSALLLAAASAQPTAASSSATTGPSQPGDEVAGAPAAADSASGVTSATDTVPPHADVSDAPAGTGTATDIIDHEMKADEADVLRRTAPGAVTAHSTGAGEASASSDVSAAATDQTPLGGGAGSGSAEGIPPALARFTGELMAQLRAKADASQLANWMASAHPHSAPGDGASGELVTPEQRLLALAHCVLIHGAANYKHASTLLERYRPLLTSVDGLPGHASHALHPAATKADDVRAHIVLSAVEQVWHAAPHQIEALAGLLVDGKIVTSAQVAAFAVSPCVRFPSRHYHVSVHKATAAAPSLTSPAEVTSDLPGHHVLHRLIQPRAWALLHSALERASATAQRAAVELAMFRGDKCYDVREEELDADVAEAKEAELVTSARSGADARDAAVGRAVTELVRACRTLEAHIWHLSASSRASSEGDDGAAASTSGGSSRFGDDTPEAAREVLRVALAHLRQVLRSHAHLWSPDVSLREGSVTDWQGMLTSALSESTGLLAHTREYQAASSRHGGLSNPEGDLAAAAVLAARAYVPTGLEVPPSLLRDRSRAQPTTLQF